MSKSKSKSNFQLVSAMNEAFDNRRASAANVDRGDWIDFDWARVHKQCLNLVDELGELMVALGASPDLMKHLVAEFKLAAQPNPERSIDHEYVRDALCDLHVFAYGAHHLMGVDADADLAAVIEGVMTRFIKDDADKAATIAKHAAAGVTDVYFEGDYPTMVMKSGSDQPDAPRGKFLKSASYREPMLPALPGASQ